jgi:hypothetical protein
MSEEKKAKLTMKLRTESGYCSNEQHTVSAEQWAEIQFICADGPERQKMRDAITAKV